MGRKASEKAVRIVDAAHAPNKDTREQVCKMVACGLDAKDIAFVFGCAEYEVKQHYEHEIEHGLAVVTAMVGGALVKNAIRGDTNAQRAFLQMRARWTTPQHVAPTSGNGGAAQVEQRRALLQRVLGLLSTGQATVVPGQARTEAGQDAPVA